MLKSSLYMQRSLVQDNGHSLVPVLRKSGTPSKRTVYKEFGTISRKRCWWNSSKADVRFSVLRLLCPEVTSEAKVMENCRYTTQPSRKQLRLCRIIVSVSRLNLYGAVHGNVWRVWIPFTINQSDLMWWWENQLCSVRSGQKANQNFLLQQYEERIERLSQ